MDEKTLRSLLSTLNAIEVSGSKNLNYLLGSIQTVEKALADIQTGGKDG